ncbi:MAG: TonB family protein [Flavobacteriales bacterium]
MEFINGYHLQSELGRGGMARVYLAHDNKFDTNVAIKVLNKEFVHNDNIRKRFLAEAKSMFKMSHPNIIKVTDLIDEGGTVAFVMEYIEGETLKEYIDRKGKLKDEEIKNIFSQMLDAVGYVHKQNLVHRDIKPSNFMIDREGKVKLMDFGIAKTLDASSSEYTQTGTGAQMGTPMYMSPEQITETKSVTAQSDIYSLGVVLWQMVTGQKPYDTKTLSRFQLESKIVNEPLPSTRNTWDAVISKATAKEVHARFSSTTEFSKALYAENNTSDNDDATVIEPDIVVKEKSNFNTYLFSGVIIILMLIFLGIFFFRGEQKSSTQINEKLTILNNQKKQDIDSIGSLTSDDRKFEVESSTPPANSENNQARPKEVNEKKTGDELVSFVEVEPIYPGGIEKLYEDIYRSITYPELERENNIQGTVYISFVVEKSGEITDIKVERGIVGGPNLNKEAVKAVKNLSHFTPAKLKDKTVRYRYRIPIKFW